MDYEVSKRELKIIDKDFRRYASRLLKTKRDNEIRDLTRFINYINSQPLIMSFINKNNTEKFDMENIINNREWTEVYDIPVEKNREIAWVYQFLIYCKNNVDNFIGVSDGYKIKGTIQDNIDTFCHEVIKPFIDHITDFIGEVMIEMGYDENTPFKIEIGNNNGQINISKDDSTINATNIVNNIENDIQMINELSDKFIEQLKDEDIDEEEKEMIIEDVEVIREQIDSDNPRLPRIKRALQSLKGLDKVLVKGTGIMLALNDLYAQVETFINKF